MKKNNIFFLAILITLSCSKTEEIKNYDFEATIVGQGDNTDYYVLNITNISGDRRITDGVYFALRIHDKFDGVHPFTGYGYEGTRIKLNCSLFENNENELFFMGQAIPILKVYSAIIDENQEENIDQRMINNNTKCLPFRNVYGTKQFDINKDDSIDFEFMFWNTQASTNDSVWTYSDLSMYTFSNFIYLVEPNSIQAQEGDTIELSNTGIDWDKFVAGKNLLRYHHRTAIWDESSWKLGEAGYLKLMVKKNDKFHTAWMQFRVDLDSSCKCSVSILDSYYNPEPNQYSIVGFKD